MREKIEMSKKTLIIDYKVGNHQSVSSALNWLGYENLISRDIKEIKDADIFILPGVGAFSQAMQNLKKFDLIRILEDEVLSKGKPILGICLGMQVLAESSVEDGFHEGLGWIKGTVERIEAVKDCRVPHVGWSELLIKRRSPLFDRVESEPHYYFDHSYHFVCEKEFVSSTCFHGIELIASVQKDNVFGVQFHPEKSQTNGLKLFRSFFNYVESLETVVW